MFIIEEPRYPDRLSVQSRRRHHLNRTGGVIAVLALFVAGLTIALVRRMPVMLLLMPIVFVPLTICFMLISALLDDDPAVHVCLRSDRARDGYGCVDAAAARAPISAS